MFTVRRKAVQIARHLGTRQARQYSAPHDSHHGHSANNGHFPGQESESFGRSFYIVLFAIPTSIAVYAASRPSADGKKAEFSRLVEAYADYKERWATRNHLHTAMIEQAGFDRNVFQTAKGSAHIDLRFPEGFNTGSPYNVVAGASARGMDKLVAHYEKQNVDESERKLKEMKRKEAFFKEKAEERASRQSYYDQGYADEAAARKS
ncbi:hypothetical protein BJ878DRAFT_499131 [Calycina marina]|uniref:NADH-ubiquinone oxidoreductase 17.8 kDa subunit n=1 Tax=Calycina marina TaxID=1763456 RepID=A0A9P8CGR3_9HELO|nr:hypothetical protein BJ878DRAFT_499131 [Calycina marina]